MNFKKILAFAAVIGLLAHEATAQLPIDQVKVPRTVQLLSPVNIIGIGNNMVSNNLPFDHAPFVGQSVINVFAWTNAAGAGTLTFQVFGSPDTTNWTAITNFAVVTNTTAFVTTNSAYNLATTNTSANILTTNNVFLPGTLTTPSATSGYAAIPYIAYSQLTSAAGATTISAGGYAQLYVNLQDQPRYLQIQFKPAGANTNWTVGATIVTTPIQSND